jgi:putative Mg2+ transporter-C (MgtC) family protein
LISPHGFGPNSNPAQVAAGVVAGIGFIGGGVIMRRGGSVQGINSAATLWATASMGLALGTGYYTLAWRLLLVVLAAQFALRWLASFIDRRSGFFLPDTTCHVEVRLANSVVDDFESLWSDFIAQTGISISRTKQTKRTEAETAFESSLNLAGNRVLQLQELLGKINTMPGVTTTEWKMVLPGENE